MWSREAQDDMEVNDRGQLPFTTVNLLEISQLPGSGPTDALHLNVNHIHRIRKNKFLSVKLLIISYPSVLTYVLGVQKNVSLRQFF